MPYKKFRQSSTVFEKPGILSYLQKLEKDLVSAHSLFTLLLITQDLNKIKKIRNTLL